ncbi:MAG: energy transducer TonB [Bacteroidia bacterium]
MKYAVLFFFAFSFLGLAAQDSSNTDSIISVVETMPEYPGGQEAMFTFLKDNVKYPKYEKKKKIEGTAYVRFIIEGNGQVGNVDIYPGTEERATKAMREEAIRVVKLMPDWKPGTQQGKPVRVQYAIPIMFTFK